jgi:hypothetical protein
MELARKARSATIERFPTDMIYAGREGYLTRSAQETRLSPVQPAEIGAKHRDGATPKIVRF